MAKHSSTSDQRSPEGPAPRARPGRVMYALDHVTADDRHTYAAKLDHHAAGLLAEIHAWATVLGYAPDTASEGFTPGELHEIAEEERYEPVDVDVHQLFDLIPDLPIDPDRS